MRSRYVTVAKNHTVYDALKDQVEFGVSAKKKKKVLINQNLNTSLHGILSWDMNHEISIQNLLIYPNSR